MLSLRAPVKYTNEEAPVNVGVGAVEIKVVYAERGRCVTLSLRAATGETVAEIIRRCGILKQCPPGLDPLRGDGAVGIFGERVALDAVPAAGDRIEIYRPLNCGPMEARRRRSTRQA